MSKILDEVRMSQLVDHIRKDIYLLNKYEDELRYITDPRLIENYKRNIERQRDSLAQNQREYDEIMGSLQEGIELLPEKKIKDELNIIREIIFEANQNKTKQYSPQLANDIYKMSEILDNPKFEIKQRLKYSIPIIPLILSYEGEIGLNVGLKLKKVWQDIKAGLRSND